MRVISLVRRINVRNLALPNQSGQRPSTDNGNLLARVKAYAAPGGQELLCP